MRWAWVLLVMATACEDDTPCGVDGDGDVIPVCVYNAGDGAPSYCPEDQFVSADGCASCGCGFDGRITCTDNLFCETTPQ